MIQWPATPRPDDTAERPALFPDLEGQYPPCERCFQRTPDLAHTATPGAAPADGPLAYVCGGCHHALAGGRPLPLPTGQDLARTWKRVARWTVNEEITPDLTGRALETLAPHLDHTTAQEWFQELCAALLWQQELAGPGYDLLQHEPEMRDDELLDKAAAERVADAIDALTHRDR